MFASSVPSLSGQSQLISTNQARQACRPPSRHARKFVSGSRRRASFGEQVDSQFLKLWNRQKSVTLINLGVLGSSLVDS